LTQLMTSVLTVIGVLIMMFTISWILAGISLLAVPLSIGVTIVIAKRSQKQFAAQWKHTGLLNGHIEEMHTGHSIVKVFGRQQDAIDTFDEHNGRLYEAEERPDAAAPRKLGQAAGRVAFENVSFRYKPETPLIEDMSLNVEPGQTIAIVGPTGAGKTTLVNLLMRFYDVDSGRITVDGVDISTVDRQSLRSRIGMVLQDTWLLGGTIYDNIAYGRPDASEDEVIAAATAAYVDRFVHMLPGGYQTIVSDDGGNISAGEKQLITIARAFL